MLDRFEPGQEQKLTTQLIEALPEAALEGKNLGGEVLVQLKANQKTTLEEATRRLNQSAPPFYTQPQNLSHGRIDIRGVRSIPVTPIQVNFPVSDPSHKLIDSPPRKNQANKPMSNASSLIRECVR